MSVVDDSNPPEELLARIEAIEWRTVVQEGSVCLFRLTKADPWETQWLVIIRNRLNGDIDWADTQARPDVKDLSDHVAALVKMGEEWA